MCGIVGQVGVDSSEDKKRATLQAQLATLAHRGPDGQGVLVDPKFGFGHARLSIIDLATGAQPMTYADGRYTITYNGEIYNYLELKKELLEKGMSFATQSDTEVILAGFAAWGEDIFTKLNGMFALAIYDKLQDKLMLARDPYGQKPLFYLQRGQQLHFASELKAFQKIDTLSVELDPHSLSHYLAFECFYGDRSIFKNIKKIPPGHFLTFQKGQSRLRRYFYNVPHRKYQIMEDAEKYVHRALQEAVKISFRADVPVGILLSGGLDSSLVLGLLREGYPQRTIHSFTLQNEDATYDESHYALQAAKRFNTEHENFRVGLKEIRDLALEVPTLLDQPQADPGILPKYYICQQVRKHVKVALTGDGGDEFFYGYLIFKAEQLAKAYKYIPGWVHSKVIKPLAEQIPSESGYMRKDFLIKQFMKGFPAPDSQRNFHWTCSFTPKQAQALLLRGEAAEDPGIEEGFDFFESLQQEAKGSGRLGAFAYRYQQTYLPDYILPNSDRGAMLNSVELRAPLLDVRLTRELNLIADSIKMKGLSTKHLMKRIARHYLSDNLIHRKKIGFTVPIASLLREDLKPTLLEHFESSKLKSQGLFDPQVVHNLLERHFSGKENLYKPIWTLYTLQSWLLKNGYS
jgi:asparagine synthase (glutamine-hydrolysing)